VVLTADRTLTAGYDLLFDGMLAASQTTATPHALLDLLLLKRAPGADGRAARAPLGLRRIEAALLGNGFASDEVVVAEEAQLAQAIGPATRVVGISSGEPAGRGMNSSTMTAIAGGRILPEECFRRLTHSVRKLIAERAPKAKIVLGGPGAWQAAQDAQAMAPDVSADHVVTGHAEGNAAEVFRRLMDGGRVPGVLPGQGVPAERIPAIRGASTMGVVEISRGCGLGCRFCTIAREPMVHLPEESILADVRTNVAAGQANAAVLSEDFFRYGAENGRPRPGALLSLLERLRQVPGLRLIQIDHANLSSVSRWTDPELASAHRLLAGGPAHRFLWVNVGVETAAGELLKAQGGLGKMAGVKPEEWGEFAAEQVRRLIRAEFFPLVSLLLGLPGETREDVRRTLEWVHGFRDQRLAIFPMLYAPVDGTPAPGSGRLNGLHWELLRACYRLNFRWIPKLYWDNQTGAGVPLSRRMLIQVLGRGQTVQWTMALAWRAWRSRKDLLDQTVSPSAALGCTLGGR
jgi:radical SAM superfamily enzyme YgiQ (UPF0313 family)